MTHTLFSANDPWMRGVSFYVKMTVLRHKMMTILKKAQNVDLQLTVRRKPLKETSEEGKIEESEMRRISKEGRRGRKEKRGREGGRGEATDKPTG